MLWNSLYYPKARKYLYNYWFRYLEGCHTNIWAASKSTCHKEAVMKWDQHNKGTSINSQLQHQLQPQQEKARNCLLKLFTSIVYLARQGLPLRCHLEHNGNFHQLMQLRANDCDDLKVCLQQKSLYISWNPRWDAQDYVSSNTNVDINKCLHQQVDWWISDRAGVYIVIHTYKVLKYQTIFYHTFFFSSLSFALGTSALKHMKFIFNQ